MRFRFEGCELDTAKRELRLDDVPVPLEPKVYALLVYLIEHRADAVSKDELIAQVWPGRVIADATLTNAVKLARQATGDDGRAQRVIRTVRGHGYRFVAEVTTERVVPSVTAAPVEIELVTNKPSIALLNFDVLGEHGSAQVFSEGLAVDLNAQLTRLHGLFVIARQSARRFSLADAAPVEVGTRLGVRYVVYGTCQVSTTRIRVTINLAETVTRELIWSERFDRDLGDIFAVQDDIVTGVVAQLLPEIERAEMERARLVPTENLDAWEAYHRAMWHNLRFTAGDADAARGLLARALEVDPHFARAHAGLSFNHFVHAFLHTDAAHGDHVGAAFDFAEQAVGFDARDAMSHWALGRAQFLQQRHDAAIDSLDRAIVANPNYAQGRYARGFVGAHAGHTQGAVEDLDLAARLSPFDPLLFAVKCSRAISMTIQGDHAAAADLALEATSEPNAHFHIHAIAGACLEIAGRHAEARQAIARACALRPGYTIRMYELSFPHKTTAQGRLFTDAMAAARLPAG